MQEDIQLLVPGELLIFEEENGVSDRQLSDSQINEKYMRGEVRIVTEQARYPLDSIGPMLKSGKYELNPEFQRRFRWNREKQSRLIESFIMNVPIPPIFLYEDKYSHYEVMDGLQRLTAIQEFYANEFALDGLKEWSELNGRRYSELPEQIKRGIDRRYLSSIILLQETAKSPKEAQQLKQLVFERINSGGVELAGQESRNAIYNGPLNQLCIKLSRNLYLCRAWGIPEPTPEELEGGQPARELLENDRYREMEDVELVLRFFAFRQRLKHNWGSLTNYLDRYLQYGNLLNEDILKKLEELFEGTIKLAYKLFEDKTFKLRRQRKSSGWEWSSSPSVVVYDSMMYVLSQHLDLEAKLISNKELISKKIIDLYEENSDSFAGRDVNKKNFEERIRLYTDLFSDFI